MSLSVCPSCARHVRERACPFCGADVPPVVATPRPRVARIALLGAAVVATACGTTLEPVYGAPAPDAAANDAAQNPDATAAFYGAVPFDAGPDSGDGGDGG